jgi:hypothetical protein
MGMTAADDCPDYQEGWLTGRVAADVVTGDGDLVTGIQHLADALVTRGVLLDVGRAVGEDGELPDGYPITAEDLQRTIEAQGPTAQVRRGDAVLVRTGQLTRRAPRPGGPAPDLSFHTAGWLHGSEIAAIATDTWGFEVRPNEFPDATQPCIKSPSPTSDSSSASCGILTGSPPTARRRRGVRVPVVRAAAPVHRGGRLARQPDRPQVILRPIRLG